LHSPFADLMMDTNIRTMQVYCSLHMLIGVRAEWKVSGVISLFLMDLSKSTENAVKWECHFNNCF
jgi:hypothetical protein